jgi:hypothetical protein
MNTEIANKPTQQIDGFDADIVEGKRDDQVRVIQGTLVKFTNEATWITPDGKELSEGLELIAVDVARIVQKWANQLPVETIVLEPDAKWPDVDDLNAQTPKAEWVDGPDGQPRGPWQAQRVVYLVDPATMTRYSYPTGTTGGSIAVRELVDQTKWMRRFRGANVYAVVTLGDKFMPTRFGGRQRPHFNIKRWMSLGGGDAEQAALPAQTVSRPSLKEEMGDEIPH